MIKNRGVKLQLKLSFSHANRRTDRQIDRLIDRKIDRYLLVVPAFTFVQGSVLTAIIRLMTGALKVT